jgi:homopolymeric O-antigen transport system ATP-binding protein
MTRPILEVDNVSKRYRLGQFSARTLSEEVERFFRRYRSNGKADGLSDAPGEYWALKDVSFSVQPGEVLGIIGHNGAGKSTLLKILSRITEPTNGEIRIRGRIASLLEVGTGFHPELTGRENIYLNGAILGMRQAEIARKFDEIVAFAEIEKFLDTPLKRYSSGMYVRLAFAVAAHLEPEILLVDEVLAVGDVEFQRKCLGKIGEVARGGRTVLFVSHNMLAVRKLCSRAFLLAEGRIACDEGAAHVINKYLSVKPVQGNLAEVDLTIYPNRYGSGEVRVTAARLLDHSGNASSVLERLKPAALELTIAGQSTHRVILSAICMTIDGTKLLQLDHHDAGGFEPGLWNGSSKVRVEIEAMPLQCGQYQWALGVHSETLHPIDVVLEILPFRVEDDLRNSPRPYRSTFEHGFCTLLANWRFST